MSGFNPPGDCPVCGAFVPAGQSSCKSCGSCPKSGWSEDTAYDGLDLPEEAYGSDELSSPGNKKPVWKRLVMAAAIFAAAVLLWLATKP